jgi:hypothetical protein
MSFTDWYRTMPEAARLLRVGGLLVFNMTSPLRVLVGDDPAIGQPTTCLQLDYFGLRRFESRENGTVDFQLPYREWIRFFRRHGLMMEDLTELRPSEAATSTYDLAPLTGRGAGQPSIPGKHAARRKRTQVVEKSRSALWNPSRRGGRRRVGPG